MVTLDKIAQRLNPTHLPSVRDARMSERDAYMEFMGQFNTQDREGVVSLNEFVQVHRALSGSISNCDEYASVVRGCWKA